MLRALDQQGFQVAALQQLVRIEALVIRQAHVHNLELIRVCDEHAISTQQQKMREANLGIDRRT